MTKILFSNGAIINFDLTKDKRYIKNLMKDLKEVSTIYFNKYKENGKESDLQDSLNAKHDLALLQNNFLDLWTEV